ncbi:MAG: TPM domain-containing protein [Clostridia bacterium]|nr:TPM domain-containing protein [Clostridia bacterium]
MTKKIIVLCLALLVCFCLAIPVSAETAGGEFLFDEADILTDAEEAQLAEKLSEASHTYEAQIIIATVPSIDGNMEHFIEETYDSMGWGYGEKRDGVLLLVCMDPREYRILSNGYAGVAITVDDIGNIGEYIVSDLSDGNYAAAFDTFIDETAYYLSGYLYGFPFEGVKSFGVSLVIGIIAGVVVALVLKGQLKSVKKQDQAHEYVKPGSMQVTVQRDLFLYREVSRVKKESSSGSGRGSSGSSRSVGGGSF